MPLRTSRVPCRETRVREEPPQNSPMTVPRPGRCLIPRGVRCCASSDARPLRSPPRPVRSPRDVRGSLHGVGGERESHTPPLPGQLAGPPAQVVLPRLPCRPIEDATLRPAPDLGERKRRSDLEQTLRGPLGCCPMFCTRYQGPSTTWPAKSDRRATFRPVAERSERPIELRRHHRFPSSSGPDSRERRQAK